MLYNEGFVLLTGSWDLTEENFKFDAAGSDRIGKWKDFCVGANDGLSETDLTPSASFSLAFQGTNYINTITMHADAGLEDLNYSSNPTFIKHGLSLSGSSTKAGYIENDRRNIKNTISSSFYNYEEDFKRQTFISKIGIYDENKNLIAIANLAKPVKKLEDRDYTFRLKLDI